MNIKKVTPEQRRQFCNGCDTENTVIEVSGFASNSDITQQIQINYELCNKCAREHVRNILDNLP